MCARPSSRWTPTRAKSHVVPVPPPQESYAILNSLVGHIAVLNAGGTVVFINEAWKQFAREHGDPPLRAAGPGANYLAMWMQAASDGVPGAAAIHAALAEVLAGKRRRYSAEYPCDAGSEQHWFAMNVAPLEGENGGAVTSHLDITRRRRAEIGLGKNASTIQALVDSATQAIVAVDQRGKFAIVNACTEKMFGYTRDELLQQSLEVLVPDDRRGKHAGHHQRYFDAPQTRSMGLGLELEGRRKDGSVFPVEIGLSAAETPEGRLGVAFVTDITERKRRDALLAEREREVKTLLDNSPDVIMRIDRELRYRFVNSTTAKVAGIPRESFPGRTPRELGLPENLCEIWDSFLGGMFESGLPRVIEISFASPSGAETIWEERGVPESGADGTVESVLVIGRDITKRRHLENSMELRGAEVQSLAARLLGAQEEERRRVSRELHDNLVQRLASLAFDMGGLAADLPSPERTRARLRAFQARVVKVSEEARHIAHELHPSVLDDLGLVISLKALCDELADEQDIMVEFKNDSQSLTIPAEVASGLFRIAQESLHNIAKHARAKRVNVQLAHLDGGLSLCIADDGAGFDVAAVKGQGGLGLVSMEERARLLGAKLSIESIPGHGTRIDVLVNLP